MKKVNVTITILRTLEVPDVYGDDDIRVEIEEGSIGHEEFTLEDANDIEWSTEPV